MDGGGNQVGGTSTTTARLNAEGCLRGLCASEVEKFCIFWNRIVQLVNTYRHKFRADE